MISACLVGIEVRYVTMHELPSIFMNRILAVDSKALTGSADWLVPVAACSSRSTRTTCNRDALLRSAVVLCGEVGTELHWAWFQPGSYNQVMSML